ncbi:M15 family peptidase [Rhodobacteraceae bacterium CCMM004]|nr:M15 family peptidase [Rhodobacteraceae bacterium CCMM004]
MRLIPLVIAGIVLLAAPLVYLGVRELMPEDRSAFVNATGPAVDSAARIEIEALRQRMDIQDQQIAALQEQIRELAARPPIVVGPTGPGATGPSEFEPTPEAPRQPGGPNAIVDAYAQVVLIPNRRRVNKGLTVGGSRWLEEFLGRPRENLSDRCEPMTNPKLRAMLKLESVGPIRVNMLQPAIDSITRVFENVKAADPDLYERINTAGSLCVRQIRGTRGRTSTHSFGLAVDLNIDGVLDTFGDGKTQLGLTILADFFIAEGWVWGAAFGREDSMHFEVSKQKLTEWREEGKI